jgi:hypothetical protein
MHSRNTKSMSYLHSGPFSIVEIGSLDMNWSFDTAVSDKVCSFGMLANSYLGFSSENQCLQNIFLSSSDLMNFVSLWTVDILTDAALDLKLKKFNDLRQCCCCKNFRKTEPNLKWSLGETNITGSDRSAVHKSTSLIQKHNHIHTDKTIQ